MRWPRAVIAIACCISVLPGAAGAFGLIDTIDSIQADIDAWEEVGTRDFSTIEQRLQALDSAIFSDVALSDWFSPYVSVLSEWRIVSGYRDASGELTGEYRPGNPVTLGETLKMAMGAARIDTRVCGARTGTGAEHWAAGYARCAASMRMRVDVADLEAPALRWQVITILHDAFGDRSMPLFSGFIDVRGHPAESDIALAALRGIVSGDDGSNVFRPDDEINRAEVAKILVQRIRLEVRRKASEVF